MKSTRLVALMVIVAALVGALGAASAIDSPTMESETTVSGEQVEAAEDLLADMDEMVVAGDLESELAEAEDGEEIEVIVRFEDDDELAADDVGTTTVEEIQQQATQSQTDFLGFAQSAPGVDVVNQFWLVNAVMVELEVGETDLDDLTAHPDVDRVHANFDIELTEPTTSEELTADEVDTTYGLDQINAPDVYEQGITGAGATVAVLDTGVDPNHPDIDIDEDNWAEFDADGEMVDEVDIRDSSDHGTHVSGTVVGGDASGTQIGVAPDAELLHGLVLPGGSGTFAQVIGGMEWAAGDADVINLSLGADGQVPELIEPTQNAIALGTLPVAAVGNTGEGSSGTPGSVLEDFAVGATDEGLDVTGFSSGQVIDTEEDWGDAAPEEYPDEYIVPDVSAPGDAVTSAIPGGGYGEKSGTSMAAPHTAGTIALMISAVGGDQLSTELIEDVLIDTAFKPEGEPEEQDTRYGHGIIDAHAATDEVALESGIEGTVTDTDGEPVDATVSTDDGFSTDTDEDGAYSVLAQPGEVEVTAEAFGFQTTTETVTVEEEQFSSLDLELEDRGEIRLVENLPEFKKSGSPVTATVNVANIESMSLELVGEDYETDEIAVQVDGEEVAFDETIEFEEPRSDEVDVTVEAEDGTNGAFAVQVTAEGPGEADELQLGPTTAFDERIDAAVVTNLGADFFGDATIDRLEQDPQFDAELIGIQEDIPGLIEDDELDTYDVYVAHRFFLDTDRELIQQFSEETADADVGTVYLDQWGLFNSDSIKLLSGATGDPLTVEDGGGFLVDSPPTFDVEQPDHPIFEDVIDNEGEILIHEAPAGDLSFFEGFTGVTLANASGTQDGEPVEGGGIAVDDGTQEVLAASLGDITFINPPDWTDEANRILQNSVRFANADTPIDQVQDQSRQISPGESVEVVFDVEDIDQYELSLDTTRSTLSEDDLDVHVNSKQADFDQALAYDDGLTDEEFTIEVTTDADVVGEFTLEHRFSAPRDDFFAPGDDNYFSGTGSTAVYEPPIEVPEDFDTIQEAADIVPSGERIVLADGTYEEMVHLPEAGKDDITLEAAENASPTIAIPDDPDTGTVPTDVPVGFVSTASGLTIDGVNVDANDEGAGIFVDGDLAVHDVDVHNGAEDLPGIQIGQSGLFSLTEVTADVQNVTVEDSGIGISVLDAPGSELKNVHVVDSQVGVNADHSGVDSADFHLTESQFEGIAGPAVQTGFATDGLVEHIDVHDAGLGVEVGGDLDVRHSQFEDIQRAVEVGDGDVEDNHVENATIGVDITQFSTIERIVDNEFHNVTVGVDAFWNWRGALELTHNEIDGDIGIVVGAADDRYFPDPTDDTEISYNNLAGADTPFLNVAAWLDRDSDELPETFDGRLNYYGDSGPAADDVQTVVDREGVSGSPNNIFHLDGIEVEDGGGALDPFLLEHPDHEDIVGEPAEETAVGLSLNMEAGDQYAVGVPGPTEQTVGELFEDGFEGVAYGFGAGGGWELLEGDDELNALEAIAVVADSDGVATFDFRADGPGAPGSIELHEGWNFVSPPMYGDIAETVGIGTAEVSLAMHLHDRPAGQIGPAGVIDGLHTIGDDGGHASPLEGYFMFADEDGQLPATVTTNTNAVALHDQLGLEYDLDALGQTPATSGDVTDLDVEVDPIQIGDAHAVSVDSDSELVAETADETGKPVDAHEFVEIVTTAMEGQDAETQNAIREAVMELAAEERAGSDLVDLSEDSGPVTVEELEAVIDDAIESDDDVGSEMQRGLST